jgi:hypothetical protein
MKRLGWSTRLLYATVAGFAGWIAGFLLTTPFEISEAWRYVDGQSRRMAWTLAEGLAIWAAFTLFMAVAGWLLLVWPVVLVVSPRWVVRWRGIVIPASGAAAVLAIGVRLHLFIGENFVDLPAFEQRFFTPQVIFALVFALALTATYCMLARRRLEA